MKHCNYYAILLKGAAMKAGHKQVVIEQYGAHSLGTVCFGDFIKWDDTHDIT